MKFVSLIFTMMLCWSRIHAIDVEILFRVDLSDEIDFNGFDPQSDSVTVKGNFNNWAGCVGQEMSDLDQDGIYEIEIQFQNQSVGQTYEFKYNICNRDKWEDRISNRSISLTGAEVDTDGDGFVEAEFLGIFNHTGNEPVERADIEVTFKLDMSVQEELERFDPEIQSPVVRGSFNEWNCSSFMEDPDGDGVYEIQLTFFDHPIGNQEFKFNLGCSESHWETIQNRTFHIWGDEADLDNDGFLDIEVDLLFYDDVQPTSLLCDVEVLFQVDMRAQIENVEFNPEFDQVVVRGAFNNWSCSDPFEDSNGDGIYQLEIPMRDLQPGVQEYKYNINCSNERWEARPNRSFDVSCFELDEDQDQYGDILIPTVGFDDETRERGPAFIRGDADGNGKIEIADVVINLSYQFLGTIQPECFDAFDADDSGTLEISDPILVISYQFLGNSPIPPPNSCDDPGDLDLDELDCEGSDFCEGFMD